MKLLTLSLILALLPQAHAQEDGNVTDEITINEATWETVQKRTPDIAPLDGEPSMRFYDVNDIVLEALGGPMPSRMDMALDQGEEALAIEGRAQALREETAQLAALLSTFAQPKLAEGHKIETPGVGGVLVAFTRPAQHAWIEGVLTLLRTKPMHHQLEVWYIEAPRGSFKGHIANGSAIVLSTPEERETFLALTERPEFELLSAMELLARDLQRCDLRAIEQVPYVEKYELVVVEPGAQEIADPHIAVLDEGYSLGVRALRITEDQLGLDLALTRAWIERPIPTRKIRLSAAVDSEVEISSPTSHQTDVRARMVLAPGASVVFITPANDEARDLAVVVSVRTVSALVDRR